MPLLDLAEVYATSDYLTLHALVTDDTRGMINAASIATMKDGVRIINAARGALINSADLAGALASGKVAGAALDVYETEPPPPDHPLIRDSSPRHNQLDCPMSSTRRIWPPAPPMRR